MENIFVLQYILLIDNTLEKITIKWVPENCQHAHTHTQWTCESASRSWSRTKAGGRDQLRLRNLTFTEKETKDEVEDGGRGWGCGVCVCVLHIYTLLQNNWLRVTLIRFVMKCKVTWKSAVCGESPEDSRAPTPVKSWRGTDTVRSYRLKRFKDRNSLSALRLTANLRAPSAPDWTWGGEKKPHDIKYNVWWIVCKTTVENIQTYVLSE